MQFTIPAYLFSTALPIKQFNSEKQLVGNTHTTKTESAPPLSSAFLRPRPLLPPPIAFYHNIWKDFYARFSVKWSWYRRTRAILPHSTFGQKWVKDAILYGFTRPTNWLFQISDSRLQSRDIRRKRKISDASCRTLWKKKSDASCRTCNCQLPHYHTKNYY